MTEYIYASAGELLANESGEVFLARAKVVRCRDCKRYRPKEGQMFSCRFEHKGFTQWRSAEPDGFCAWGEGAVD